MTYQTINPATGQLVKTYADIPDQDLESAIAKAHWVFETDWCHRPIAERSKIISAAATILRQKSEEYARHLTFEMGKLINETRAEVALSADILDYYARKAAHYLKPRKLPETSAAELHIEPLGVLLGIEPWNFPYYQIARVAGPQLMVGKVLLLKHAENVPQSALAFARLFEEAGAPTGVYTNIFASIPQISAIIGDPRVCGVTISGSEHVGAAVAELTDRYLKRAVLEMGGSDPLIVLEDAPLESTLNSAIFGRMFNTGQCCVGSKRIIVVGKERGKEFLDGFIQRMAALKAGDPENPETTLGPLSSEKTLNTLLHQIARAKQDGGKIVLAAEELIGLVFTWSRQYLPASIRITQSMHRNCLAQWLHSKLWKMRKQRFGWQTRRHSVSVLRSLPPMSGAGAKSQLKLTAAWFLSTNRYEQPPNYRLAVSNVRVSVVSYPSWVLAHLSMKS